MFQRIVAHGIEVIVRDSISGAHGTTGDERSRIMPVTVVVFVVVVKMQS